MVQVYTGSGQAGQSVRRPPLPLSVQLQALPSSLREDSKQIVMDYQSANWCLEWKSKWLRASDLGIMSRQFHLSHPLWAQPHPHSFHDWRRQRRNIKEHKVSVPCWVRCNCACMMRQRMVIQSCERKLSYQQCATISYPVCSHENDPRPPLNQLDISLALRW